MKPSKISFLFIFIGLFLHLTCPAQEAAPENIESLMQETSRALNQYEEDVGTYPSTRQGLRALTRRPITVNPEKWKGPYLEKIPKDPRGAPLEYVFPGEHDADFDLFSRGPDGEPGNRDDVVNWNRDKYPPGEATPDPSATPLPEALNPKKDYTEKNGNLYYEMVWLEPGSFIYGSYMGPYGPPVVNLDGYWIGKYEVTARQYCIFLNAVNDPEGREYISIFDGSTIAKKDGVFVPKPGCAKKPAYPLSWMGASAFCQMLREGAGRNYRLPTEAQWERAARAGLRLKPYPWGEASPVGRANFGNRPGTGNERELLMPVGSFPPNPYGLYDMAGNAMEWCRDWDKGTNKLDTYKNPVGPQYGIKKILKGGNMFSIPQFIRSGNRFSNVPWYKAGGFRIVREAESAPAGGSAQTESTQ